MMSSPWVGTLSKDDLKPQCWGGSCSHSWMLQESQLLPSPCAMNVSDFLLEEHVKVITWSICIF